MKKIYVGNLSFETQESQLQTAFAAFGPVKSVTIIQDRATGRSKGFGFVEMADDAMATTAIGKMNGTDLDGRKITVNEARPKTEGGGFGGGGGGRGYGGGRDRY